jgi:hypothetical protein
MIIETPEVHASSRFDIDSPTFNIDTSGHAREGIFFARGPSFRNGEIQGANITDIAPTVLHTLGYDLPAAMTGGVLDVFAEGTDPAERDVETYDFMGADAVTGGGVTGDAEKEDEVKNRLRELGYLE